MKERYYFSIASGSTGNCGLYVSDGTAVLIDLGVSVRGLRQALEMLGMDIPDLSAVLITHEHTDHVKGLATLTKKYHVPLYATEETAQAIMQKIPHAADKLSSFRGGRQFSVGALTVRTFLTPHDAAASVGYVIESSGASFGFATDLGFVPSEVQRQLQGCDTVVLESNHDPYMLEIGPYPWSIKKRVAGAYGHLSNQDCALCAAKLVKSGTQTLILAHLSEQNNTPLTAFRETRAALDDAGVSCELYVAPKGRMEQPIMLGEEVRVCCL